MSFNSPIFFIFLTIVVGINYALSQRLRPVFLALASFVFVGLHNLESLMALLFFSLFNFYIAKIMIGKRILYICSVFVNVCAIIFFNYFSASPFGIHFSFSSISFHVDSFIIALGLSFYSLQNISYLTEVYFHRMQPEAGISKYILYNSFFPKVISGPVMMPTEFLPQIGNTSISSNQLISGFQRLLWGLFKKMIIADRIAPAVSSVFDFNDHYSGITTLFAAYLFTIQLYFDFSGYTDMALGTAKMLGYDLKENFNLPLRSTSVSEFWRRWHISLISWFTIYIYYPVVYHLRSYGKTAAFIGIALTFLISGIWHGIGLTFFAWALCHSIYLSFELFTKRFRVGFSERLNQPLYKLFSVFMVFNAVCFSNIFFRSGSMEKAFQLIKDASTNFLPADWLSGFIAPLAVGGHQIDEFNFFTSLILVIITLSFERKLNQIATKEKFNAVFIVSCVLLIMILGVFNSGERFIYMQF